MQLRRNEIMTGLLVIGTIAVLEFLLILLGAPGLFRPLVTYKIYVDNAAGIKQGAVVMLAGRKIGQVQKLFSPVSKEEERRAEEATSTMKELETTAQNLSRITEKDSELNLALGKFKTFGEHLVDLTAPDSALNISLRNIQKISDDVSGNDNLAVTLQNFRESSEKLKTTMRDLAPVGENIKEFSETIKAQPWRLVLPTTKKYPEKSPTPAPGASTITVRKSTKAKSSPTPGSGGR